MGAVNGIINSARFKIVDTQGKNFKDPELLSYANEANRMMRRAVAMLNPDLIITKETKNTVAGADTIQLDGTVLFIPEGYVNVNKKRMSQVNPGDIDDQTTQGMPLGYWQEGFNVLRLAPIPDGIYPCIIRYVAQSTPLSLEGNTSWPNDFDDIIQEYIVIRAGTRDEAIMDVEQQFMKWFIDQVTPLVVLSTPAGGAKSYW
jgi:hypothetical protein